MKIVLTGGPSAGKTSVTELLARGYPDELRIVQEAASILFRGGFPREQEAEKIKCQQRAVYFVQRELEALALIGASPHSLICDRGTLDGLAYWPADEESFFKSVGTDRPAEIARYDWVIHLETAPTLDYQQTTVRRESEPDARAIDQKVKAAWQDHPQRFVVTHTHDFIRKTTHVIAIVELILKGFTYAQIEQLRTTQMMEFGG